MNLSLHKCKEAMWRSRNKVAEVEGFVLDDSSNSVKEIQVRIYTSEGTSVILLLHPLRLNCIHANKAAWRK